MLRPAALWGLLAVLLLACERWLTSCLGTGSCLGTLAGPRVWIALAMTGITFLAVTGASAATLRIAWLMTSTNRDLRRLRHGEPPYALWALANVLRIRRLHFLDTDLPVAFCAGFLSPAVYVSRGLVEQLGGDEIKAVLLHEIDHARSFEPLRRVAWQAAAEVVFFLPLLDWARARRIERSELRADRRAMKQVGAQVVASALWTLGSVPLPGGVAAFAGTMELRVAQLLGDPLPRRLPQPSLLAASTFGTVFALAVMACATEILTRATG